MKVRLIAAGFALVLTGCPGGGGAAKLKLGSMLSLTGSLGGVGQEQLQAANLAVQEINRAGGVVGQSITIENKDDGTDETKAKTAADAFVKEGIPVVIGATGSSKCVSALGELGPKGIPMISASCTSPELTTSDPTGTFFRTLPPDTLQGKLLSERAVQKHFTKVAILNVGDTYGTPLSNEFETAFKATAGNTVLVHHQYTEGQSDYTSDINSLFAAGAPEAILLVAYPEDAAKMIKNFKAGTHAGEGTFWFFSDALDDPGFVSAAGSNLFTFQHEGTYPGTPAGSRYDTYKSAYKTVYGVDSVEGDQGVNAYDAVYLAALAMEAGKATTADAVKTNLLAVSKGGTKYGPTEYKQAAADAKAGKDIDFEGASGNLDMDDSGDVVGPYDIWHVTSAGDIVYTERSITP